jgi:hypothetical protein
MEQGNIIMASFSSGLLQMAVSSSVVVSPFHQHFSPSGEPSAVEKARKDKKRRKVASPSRSVNHVLLTNNIVERLFTQAKMILTDQRKHMNPDNLNALLFLKYNKSLWNV